MVNLLAWDKEPSENYAKGWFVGSTGEDGEHLRDPEAGWPYSVYRKGILPGVTDMCLCTGIQDIKDAAVLVGILEQRK